MASLPSLPTIPVPRPVLDVLRLVIFFAVWASLTYDFGPYEGQVEKWVTLAVTVAASLTVRQAVTPVVDPKP